MIFVVVPLNLDSRNLILLGEPTGDEFIDTHLRQLESMFKQLAEEHDLALLGARLDNMRMTSGIGDAVLTALDEFANMSGHPELAQAPIFFWGYSWGGQFSYHFTAWKPERVIGFITVKGGRHNTTDPGAAKFVPGYLFIGEADLSSRVDNLTRIFEENRANGALWTLAVEPGTGHEDVRDYDLLRNYITTVIERRLPETITPGQPVTLKSIDESSGWLGHLQTFVVGKDECYDQGKRQASWLPSEVIAQDWQAFASNGTITETIVCQPTAIEQRTESLPGGFVLAQNYPNPFNPTTLIEYTIAKASPVEILVFNQVGQRVRRLVNELQTADTYAIQWDGRDDLGKPVPSGLYLYRLTAGTLMQARKMVLLR